mgnify:CR=1 FL=1
MQDIPFHRVYHTPKSENYIKEAIASRGLAGDGAFTARCESFLKNLTGSPHVLLTSSCSTALDISALLIDAAPGDEILIPSYTFVTTANAFYSQGARPVFVDIEPDTMNIDPDHAEALITSKTKAIVPMHYGGVGCEMDRIMDLAQKYKLWVIEDAAQAVNGYYNEQHLGTFGDLGTFSFHETKNIVAGEGGALLINNPDLYKRAEIIREKGTDRKLFLQGMVDKYSWRDVGSSFVMSELQAAYLLGQLEAHHDIKTARKKLHDAYSTAFKDTIARGRLTVQNIPENCDPSYHLFYILLPDAGQRRSFMKQLKESGIHTTFHYVPLHTSTVGQKLGWKTGDLPVTEDLWARLVRLPLYPDLHNNQHKSVAQASFKAFDTIEL